ncbi:MAG: class I SAM-dependent methyltransferase [Armatimonadota bacterium]
MTQVADVYSQDAAGEWGRLEIDTYRTLEFRITMHFLRKYLPAEAQVLDAGGGPGRYTLALCRKGYRTTLLDLAPGCIAFAREKLAEEPEAVRGCLQEMVVGDIREIPYPADHFDAVLCLGGPLTHLPKVEDRQQATRELVRVTQPGGLTVLTGIGYLAVLRTILIELPHELTGPDLEPFLPTGDGPNAGGMAWHFFRADELRELAESCGLQTLEMAGLQSLSTGLRRETNALCQQGGPNWERWRRLLIEKCTEPAVVDLSEHMLYMGRKA